MRPRRCHARWKYFCRPLHPTTFMWVPLWWHIIFVINRCFHISQMVGAARFELATLWSQTRCATRLRYAPQLNFTILLLTIFPELNLIPQVSLEPSNVRSQSSLHEDSYISLSWSQQLL